MQPENEKVIKVAEQVVPSIVIAGNIEVSGHHLVSKKLLEVTNHILTELPLLKDAFEISPDCISKIRFLPNFDGLGEEHAHKFGLFIAEDGEIRVNLQIHFDSAASSLKEGNNMELMCIRAHLWFSLLTTVWHEVMHAVTYAIDPEATLDEDRETLEEIIAEQAMDELTKFVRDFECEPAAMADEPFYGTRFMEFFIREIKDNAEDWALAQNSIHQYNERNNTNVLWKDEETVVASFRHWFKIAYNHGWENDPAALVELKFSLATPTTTALEAPIHTGDEDILNEVDASPFHDEGADPGAVDRENLVNEEMLKKVGDSMEGTIELPASEMIVDVEETAVLAERGKMLEEVVDVLVPAEELEYIFEEIVEPVQEAVASAKRVYSPEEIAIARESAQEEINEQAIVEPSPEVIAAVEAIDEPVVIDDGEDYDPGDFVDEQEAIQPDLPEFPSPAPPAEVAAAIPATPPAISATGTQLPNAPQSVVAATSEPTFAPGATPAPDATGTQLPASTTQVQQAAASAAGTGFNNRQALRTGLPNHNFTAEQMREMCEQVFIRCVNHIFAKCGWTPGGNPPFVPELRGAIMEPLSMAGIPGIENFLIGMDIVDPATGTYVINSPTTAHAGMVKGKVTQKQHLPSYTLYFNYNGMEIKRFIAPQNQWKINASGHYSAPAQAAQQGAQIAWIMDGDDNSTNKWRAKVENGVVQWLV